VNDRTNSNAEKSELTPKSVFFSPYAFFLFSLSRDHPPPFFSFFFPFSGDTPVIFFHFPSLHRHFPFLTEGQSHLTSASVTLTTRSSPSPSRILQHDSLDPAPRPDSPQPATPPCLSYANGDDSLPLSQICCPSAFPSSSLF
jgi:hypothetical protein